MRIVITGAQGQLGQALCRELGARAQGLSRQQLDITDQRQVAAVLDELRPNVVINTAAYTAVDRAEQEPAACEAINAAAVGHLALACRRLQATLVQISTDYIFGGEPARQTPYREEDSPAPQSVYARTKLAGEQTAALAGKHLIVRTCGLYGLSPQRSNFVETMLRLAQRGQKLRVVNDQRCTPSYVRDVARGIKFLIDSGATGIYHVVNAGETTWYDFACEIFRAARVDIAVEAISSAQYGAAAARPAYSVLATDKYRTLGGPPLPDWREALADYLQARASTAGC